VNGLGVVAFALGALLYEAISLWILHTGARENLNVRGAFLHIASDALGSLGAIASGLAIWAYGWAWADPVASLLISMLVLHAAWRLVREALDVLMEAAPGHLDVVEIRDAMNAMPAVSNVHDLHVWTVGSGEICLSTHVVVPTAHEAARVLAALRRLLRERFAISHTTIQVESLRPDQSGDTPDALACEGACPD
jgi:cobalt-zinc-cadmium efflux system protein